MLRSQQHQFVIRDRSKAHDEKIYTSLSKPEWEFLPIVRTVFGDQRAVYKGESESYSTIEPEAAHYFYTHCYLARPVRRGNKGARIDAEEFFLDVALRDPGRRRNALSFLTGDVGVGKTSLVNYLITVKLQDQVRSRKLWFLRLDFEQVIRNPESREPLNHLEVLTTLAAKAIRVLKNFPEVIQPMDGRLLDADFSGSKKALGDLKEVLTKEALSIAEISSSFSNLTNKILEETGRRLFLIFDNLDYLAHIHDRYVFDDTEEAPGLPMLLSLHEFMRLFIHAQFLGDVGANVLFVIRFSSHRLLRQADTTSVNSFLDLVESHTFSVPRPELEDVFEARHKLLKFILSHGDMKEGTRENFKKLATVIKDHLASRPARSEARLVDHLQGIANHGLRQIMMFFTQYGWVRGESHVDLKVSRFMHQYPVGLLTFMLNGYRRFHQFDARFPNIYLVFLQPTPGFDPNHQHTYWLKRLILEYIHDAKSCTTEQILSVFSDGKSCYEESVVRTCLNNLADANHANALRPRLVRHPNKRALQVESVRLTHRGKHCVENIFDRFFYLQLIVDDFRLPIPRCAAESFRFGQLDYSYVLEESDEYSRESRKMIQLKARQVLLFIEILEISLILERERFCKTFARLSENTVPNTSNIKKGIMRELTALARVHPSSLQNDIEAAQQFVEESREKLETQLVEIYLADT